MWRLLLVSALLAAAGSAQSKSTYSRLSREFRLDQEIGMGSVPTPLTVGAGGIIYRNDNMKSERHIPWTAIDRWQGKQLGKGHPDSPARHTDG